MPYLFITYEDIGCFFSLELDVNKRYPPQAKKQGSLRVVSHPKYPQLFTLGASRGRVYDNILSVIGNTPLVRLDGFHKNKKVSIYGKFEGFSPTGSVKDKTALRLIEHGERSGLLKKGGTIIESTSGNLGVALAMVCAVKKYRFIVVVDPKIPKLNLNIMRAYGAEIEIVDMPDKSGGYQKPRIERVKKLLGSIKGSVNLDQYNNEQARHAHFLTT